MNSSVPTLTTVAVEPFRRLALIRLHYMPRSSSGTQAIASTEKPSAEGPLEIRCGRWALARAT